MAESVDVALSPRQEAKAVVNEALGKAEANQMTPRVIANMLVEHVVDQAFLHVQAAKKVQSTNENFDPRKKLEELKGQTK